MVIEQMDEYIGIKKVSGIPSTAEEASKSLGRPIDLTGSNGDGEGYIVVYESIGLGRRKQHLKNHTVKLRTQQKKRC